MLAKKLRAVASLHNATSSEAARMCIERAHAALTKAPRPSHVDNPQHVDKSDS